MIGGEFKNEGMAMAIGAQAEVEGCAIRQYAGGYGGGLPWVAHEVAEWPYVAVNVFHALGVHGDGGLPVNLC